MGKRDPRIDAYIANGILCGMGAFKAPVKHARPPKAALKTPGDLRAVLSKKKAAAEYAALSSSAKREYVEWITEFKTAATRDKRIATAAEWISEGKQRN